MFFSAVPPAYPYGPAIPAPNQYYPMDVAYGQYATEPAGAAAGAFDDSYWSGPYG